MFTFSRLSSASAALVALGMATTAVAPLITATSASAQANFSDVRGNWARDFIDVLAQRNIIAGFPDGTFQPNKPVTRAEFAAIVRQAFNQNRVRNYRGFVDVPSNYWATPAIQEAYETGFMSGYPGDVFRPNQQIPKVQALVSLASGLDLSTNRAPASVLDTFRDANAIPQYAVNQIAAATDKGLVVNYPNVRYLNPDETATRADVAAYIYQALVNRGTLQPLASRDEGYQYIVRLDSTNNNNTGNVGTNPNVVTNPGYVVPNGTQIAVTLPGATNTKFFITPGDTITTTLRTARNIVNANGTVIVPANSQIQGQFRPITVNGVPGTQFVANTITVGNRTYPINAVSNPKIATSAQALNPGTLQGSLQGGVATAAAQALISQLLGSGVNINNVLGNVLGGGTVNPIPGNQNSLIVIDPVTDLGLTLLNDLNVNPSTAVNPGTVNSNSQIASGTQVSLSYPGARNSSIVLAPGETYPLTLRVTNPIVNSTGQVVVPTSGRIEGQFVPINVNGVVGTQFVANRLMVNGQTYQINARSNVLPATNSSNVRQGVIQQGIVTPSARAALNSRSNVVVVDPGNLQLTFESGVMLNSGTF